MYFVALAEVTTPDVMWTTIAEALGLPPQGRIPPAFFDHVTHRTALLVLDNREQLSGADLVVAELLQRAPELVVLATSRRPLQLPREYEHAVPPLELPEYEICAEDTAAGAEVSGAVQLFIQQAEMARSTFRLNEGNARDVVEICRRLDGLPLAIELAAARVKLLSPSALLSRIDQALDVGASAAGRPSGQQTLRAATGWSFDLLNPLQQRFFRRLGVFASGAGLDAVAAVATGVLAGGADPLDLVSELVDASLVTISEDESGEPRICLLETIRSYAYQQLSTSGEHDQASAAHAGYFLDVAAELDNLRRGAKYLLARSQIQTEIDNFPPSSFLDASRRRRSGAEIELGMQLASQLAWYWLLSGNLSQGSS